MVTHSAVGIYTAQTRAGVLAFSVNTSLVCGTICVYLAFRAAVGRTSDHLWEAGTLAAVTYGPGRVTVWSAGVRITGISFNRFRWRRWFPTGHKWISNISLVAHADREMICHLTVGIRAAKTWTWVNTVLVSALLIGWAVRIYDTLRSTSNIRVSKMVWDTLTGCGIASSVAHSI
jgi:hypothetical protein